MEIGSHIRLVLCCSLRREQPRYVTTAILSLAKGQRKLMKGRFGRFGTAYIADFSNVVTVFFLMWVQNRIMINHMFMT